MNIITKITVTTTWNIRGEEILPTTTWKITGENPALLAILAGKHYLDIPNAEVVTEQNGSFLIWREFSTPTEGAIKENLRQIRKKEELLRSTFDLFLQFQRAARGDAREAE